MTRATERWTLVDRRDFLRRSLDDADAEHDAGDMADDDYAALRRRDEAMLAEVEARLARFDSGAGERPAPTAPARGREARGRLLRRPRRRWWMALLGVAAVAAGAVVLVIDLTSARLPGEVATGGAQLSGERLVTQELGQAAVLADQGKEATALGVYSAVLAKDPTQPTALAEAGWLEWASGSGAGEPSLERHGRSLEAEAVRVAPFFYAGHLYLGTIEFQEGDAAAAVGQFRRFLADHPPSGWAKDFAPEIRAAFSAAGEKLPAGVADR